MEHTLVACTLYTDMKSTSFFCFFLKRENSPLMSGDHFLKGKLGCACALI